ncbi:MAG: sulfatase [Verrucomicrobiota bacterium]
MRLFLLLVFLLVNLVGASDRPNILFIIADDLNCRIGPYGDTQAITPNLDRLAELGVVFEEAHCQQAVCNPSRASLFTGHYPLTTGVDDLRTHFREALPDVVTLPQALREAGYFTQGVGKVYHNMGPTTDPISWSHESYLPQGTHAADTVFAQLPRPAGTSIKKAPATESLPVPDTAYRDGRITEYALNKVAQLSTQEKPFFLAAGYWRPHLPFVAPKRDWDLYDPAKLVLPQVARPERADLSLPVRREVDGYGDGSDPDPRHLLHGYYASISFLDRQVGALLEALTTHELLDETIIVFTSDHGLHVGERDHWGKASNFDIDTRVPLLISSPAHRDRGGTRHRSPVELVDLYPTLLSLTEVGTQEELSGASLVPLLKNPDTVTSRAAFSLHQRPFYGPTATHLGLTLRTSDYRYTWWKPLRSEISSYAELYDLRTQPHETENLAQARPELAEELHQRLLDHPGTKP